MIVFCVSPVLLAMEYLAAFVPNIGIWKTEGEIIQYFNYIHNKLFYSLISGKAVG